MTTRVLRRRAIGWSAFAVLAAWATLAPGQDLGPLLPSLPIDDLPVLGPGTPPPPPTPYVMPALPVAPQPSVLPEALPGPAPVVIMPPPTPAPPPAFVPAPMPVPAAVAPPPAPTVATPAAATVSLPLLADQIVATNGAFLRMFAPGAKKVPEGKKMLEDAEDLQEAALNFRKAVRRHEPKRAEHHFREIQDEWRHLSNRAEDLAARSGIRRSPTLDLIRGTGALIRESRPLVGRPGL